jgi:hypothetical protein
VCDEQTADKPGQRSAIGVRQALKEQADIRGEAGGALGRERPAMVSEADQHRSPVRRRGHPQDQTPALRTINQAGHA